MGKVLFVITMSLDGFIADPHDEIGRLHNWLLRDGGPVEQDREILDELFKTVGAFVIGKRMFNIGDKRWGENPPFRHPVFIVTHEARETLSKQGGTTYTFVTDGIESAVSQAKAAAGENNVLVQRGANVARACMKAGLLDEMEIQIVPFLLGKGIRLFEAGDVGPLELERTRVIVSADVTHLGFRFPR